MVREYSALAAPWEPQEGIEAGAVGGEELARHPDLLEKRKRVRDGFRWKVYRSYLGYSRADGRQAQGNAA